ELTFEHC
ncbi:hypothetical protein D029_3207B, partial [Vibrio parahaemolyticus 970107]